MIKGAWKTWVIHINLAGCTDETSGFLIQRRKYLDQERARGKEVMGFKLREQQKKSFYDHIDYILSLGHTSH